MNNNPKGAKNPKKPLIFYYAVMLLVLMMLNWLLFPSLLQRQVTEVGYDEFISMVDKGQVETIAYDKQDQEITSRPRTTRARTHSTRLASSRMTSWSAVCWGPMSSLPPRFQPRPLPC